MTNQFAPINLAIGEDIDWLPISEAGTTNSVFKGYSANRYHRHLALRLNTHNVIEGVDRGRERSVLAAIQAYLWGPELLSCDDEWLVLPWYKSDDTAFSSVKSHLITAIAQLHLIEPDSEQQPLLMIDYPKLWKAYQSRISHQKKAELVEYWKRLLLQVEAAYQQVPELPKRLVHHDLHPGNILSSNEGVVIIDWEYSGIGSPWVDYLALHQHWGVSAKELGEAMVVLSDLDTADIETGLVLTAQWVEALNALWEAIYIKQE